MISTGAALFEVSNSWNSRAFCCARAREANGLAAVPGFWSLPAGETQRSRPAAGALKLPSESSRPVARILMVDALTNQWREYLSGRPRL